MQQKIINILIIGKGGWISSEIIRLAPIIFPKFRVFILGSSGLYEQKDSVLCEIASFEHGLDEWKKIQGALDDIGIKKFETVINCAWLNLGDYGKSACVANIKLQERIKRLIGLFSCDLVINLGSAFEVQRQRGAVVRGSPIDVIDHFTEAKQTIFECFEDASDYQHIWARIFYVYGIGQRSTSFFPSMLASFASGSSVSLRDPTAVLDFISITDVAKTLLVLAGRKAQSGILNIGSGRGRSVREMVNEFAVMYSVDQILDKRSSESNESSSLCFWVNPNEVKEMELGFTHETPENYWGRYLVK